MSLRFDKTTYTNGETITAIILARNTTNYDLDLVDEARTPSGGKIIGILVTTLNGQHVISREEEREMNLKPGEILWASSNHGGSIYPQTQMKALEPLNDFYNLTNGTYLAHAYQVATHYEIVNGKFASEVWPEVKSAGVPIKIVSVTPQH